MKLSGKDLLHVTHEHAIGLDELRTMSFKGVSTDSRQVKRGELFFALRGENFDGHAFVDDVVARGASCVVVDHVAASARLPIPVLVVKDTAKALGALANIYRRKFSFPVIAIAGSNGKTTTKDMAAAVLQTEYTVLKTMGNLNNHIGVPQTIFRMERKHQVAVVEIGTNHFGELAYLCGILEPTHGLITNIGREHLEFFKNLRGVSRAEGELFEFLAPSGFGFINADDPNVKRIGRVLKNRRTYGFGRADVCGRAVRSDARGNSTFRVSTGGKREFAISVPVPGAHSRQNALAATTIGLEFGIATRNIRKAIKGFSPTGKRMEVVLAGGLIILNDTYNANPDSMLSALRTLEGMRTKGKRFAVLADMKELGPGSATEHRRVGNAISRSVCDVLFTHGELARSISQAASAVSKNHFDDKAALIHDLANMVSPGDVILVKGSRSMKMEEVVDGLRERVAFDRRLRKPRR